MIRDLKEYNGNKEIVYEDEEDYEGLSEGEIEKRKK